MFQVEIDLMRDARSCLNEQVEPHEKSHSVIDQQEGRCVASFETLEDQITNCAHEISQRGGGHRGQSLASWLEAAKEILSKDSESSH